MIHPRKYTAAEWASENIALKSGEIGTEKDTKKSKIGDGHTRWNELPYMFDRVTADIRYATKAELNAVAGMPLIEDTEDPGTFIINGNRLVEDPEDPGTFLIGV